jgi:hypothetical protein
MIKRILAFGLFLYAKVILEPTMWLSNVAFNGYSRLAQSFYTRYSK